MFSCSSKLVIWSDFIHSDSALTHDLDYSHLGMRVSCDIYLCNSTVRDACIVTLIFLTSLTKGYILRISQRLLGQAVFMSDMELAYCTNPFVSKTAGIRLLPFTRHNAQGREAS